MKNYCPYCQSDKCNLGLTDFITYKKTKMKTENELREEAKYFNNMELSGGGKTWDDKVALQEYKDRQPIYYKLKKGELIKEGDECEVSNKYSDPPKWVDAGHTVGSFAPDPSFMAHRIYRRLIE